jgi:hypothetical protein
VIFEKLYPSYSKKLWKFILDESINLFIQVLLICSLKYAPEDRMAFIDKIVKDKRNMEELFKGMLPAKDVDNTMNKLMELVTALKANRAGVVEAATKLKTTLGPQYNDNCTVFYPP